MADENEPQSRYPDLGPNAADALTSIAKGLAGAVPVLGGLFGELIGEKVRGQRLDRLEDFVRRLERQFRSFVDAAAALDSSEDAIDVVAQGARLATESASPERRERIARIVAKGLSGEHRAALQASRMLRLIAQLDDEQIAWLKERWSRAQTGEKPKRTYFLGPTSADEFAPFAVRELARLGLLELRPLRQRTGNDHIREEHTARWRVLGPKKAPTGLENDYYLSQLALDLLRDMGLTT